MFRTSEVIADTSGSIPSSFHELSFVEGANLELAGYPNADSARLS